MGKGMGKRKGKGEVKFDLKESRYESTISRLALRDVGRIVDRNLQR